MKIEQSCSLDLARKLKKLGVIQESLFHWVKKWNGETGAWDLFYDGDISLDVIDEHVCAFTVAELGKLLRADIYLESEDRMLELYEFRMDGTWGIAYHNQMIIPADYRWEFEASTEADARAKMLVYLIEHNLVNF